MATKKTTDQNQSPENSTRSLTEYKHGDNFWVVEDWDKLSKLFPSLTAENMPALHALCVSRKEFDRAWKMLLRLTGIREALIPMGVDASKLKASGRERVAAIFQTDTDEVELAISYLQAAWHQLLGESDLPQVVSDADRKRPESQSSPKQASSPRGEHAQSSEKPSPRIKIEWKAHQLELLELGSFSTVIFEYPYHTQEYDRVVEVEWFCEQIRDLRKVFEEPMAKGLANQALLNQLQLRRINSRLVIMDPAEKDFLKLQDVKAGLEATYSRQWEQISELCPAAAASQGRKAAIATLSDLTKVYLDYKADPNNRARDGVFTDDELQIQFRTSQQVPDVGYRFGWVTAVNMARLGIEDPKWARRLSLEQCKILDASFQFAAKRLTERMGIPQPDLESTGSGGEYPPLYLKADGVVTEESFEEVVEAAAGQGAVEIVDPAGMAPLPE